MDIRKIASIIGSVFFVAVVLWTVIPILNPGWGESINKILFSRDIDPEKELDRMEAELLKEGARLERLIDQPSSSIVSGPDIEATVEARVKEELAAQQSTGQAYEPVSMARFYLNRGEYEKAIRAADKAIQLGSGNPEEYYERGIAYINIGQYRQAIQDFDKAIQLYPNGWLAYVDRGFAYMNLGQHERAIQDYDRAIELDPDYALAYYNRGYSYYELGQHAKADADKAKACSLDSQYC